MADVALRALKDYGEPEASFDKQGRIWIARGVTGAFLGEPGGNFIGTTSHELPAGNKITFVRRLLKLNSNSEAYQWIKKAFNLPGQKIEAQSAPLPKPKSLTEIATKRKEQRILEKVAPSTGYDELDRLIKGFVPGHLYSITGETNSGKTALCCNFAHRVSEQGRKVLYFALEPSENVVDYLASCRLDKRFDALTDDDISYDDGSIKVFTKKDIRKVEDIARVLSELPKFDLVVLDHIGYFIKGTENTTQEQSNVCKQMAEIAETNNCAILQVVHPKKPPSNAVRVLTGFDMSGSAAYFQDADEVLILERFRKNPEDPRSGYSDRGYLIIYKTKLGPSGSMAVVFSECKAIVKSESDLLYPKYIHKEEIKEAGEKDPLDDESGWKKE